MSSRFATGGWNLTATGKPVRISSRCGVWRPVGCLVNGYLGLGTFPEQKKHFLPRQKALTFTRAACGIGFDTLALGACE